LPVADGHPLTRPFLFLGARTLTCLSALACGGWLLLSCGKRADTSPKPPQLPAFEFLGAWGEKGDDPGKFDQPVAFSTDVQGNVYFADPGRGSVDKFEPKGTPLLSFEDGRLRHASGIAVDNGGAIYVADAQRGSILIFFPNGDFLRALRTPTQPHWSGPLGISVDASGNLFVPDPAHSRVLKFDARGRSSRPWKAPQEAAPANERPSGVAAGADGSIFVAYAKSGLVEKYSSDGALLTNWNAAPAPPGESDALSGIAVTGKFVFTAGPASPRIRVWTLDGQPKVEADLEGRLNGINAVQLAVTPRDELLIFDPATSRVLRFRLHL
jgi:DNA-binding beta-propeller fold protein YncE